MPKSLEHRTMGFLALFFLILVTTTKDDLKQAHFNVNNNDLISKDNNGPDAMCPTLIWVR